MSGAQIGRRVRSYRWRERSSGAELYAADLAMPGMLIGQVLRSPHPFAQIVSIDTRQARRVQGVHAVITIADFPPGVRYLHEGPATADRPPLADGVVRYIGEEVAAVAAETAEAAEAALCAIRVRYRRRRAPLTVTAARRTGMRQLHQRKTGEGNVSVLSTGSWGDVITGLTASDVDVTGTYYYPRVSHACMEPNVTVAAWDPDQEILQLWTSTQAPYFVVREVAHVLGLKQSQVVCREVAVGGGFGSKSKISEHEVLAAALSHITVRPVRIAYGRAEEFAATKPRHAFTVDLRTAANRNGDIRAFDARINVDNGAYNHYGPSVMKVGIKTLGSIYRPDGVRWDARLIDTALPPGGQFRGYGGPQVAFAMESQVDEIAAMLGKDPLEMRIRNANHAGERTLSGAVLSSARMVECLEAVRAAIDWDAKRAWRGSGRGIGVAVGMHGSGSYAFDDAQRSEAIVELAPGGHFRVRFGTADAGTGQRTVLSQVAAQELGQEADMVEVQTIDSEFTPFDMGSWSSRGTHMGAHAVRAAARSLAERLRMLGRSKLGANEVSLVPGAIRGGSGELTLAELVADEGEQSVREEYIDPVMQRSGAEPTNFSASYTFAAHAVEVEVDPTTGQLILYDYVAAHDIGVAINPTQAEGQIIGGVVMGLGAVLGEELRYEGGQLVNPAYIHYALPRAADVPAIRPILIEGGDPHGPYGAKSVGEMSIIPPAPAVANAIFHAIGVRLRDLPITPDKILHALGVSYQRSTILRRPSRWWVSGIRAAYPRGLHHLLDRWGTRVGRRREPSATTTLVRPRDLAEATAQADVPGSAYLAGGTDLLPQRKQGLSEADRLVDLALLPELRRLGDTPAGLEIGGAITLAELAAQLGEQIPALAATVNSIASAQVRETATVAGNLLQAKRCWFYRNGFTCYKRGGASCPCYAVLGDHRFYHAAMGAHRCQAVTPSDLATVLIALDAQVSLSGVASNRELPLERLYTGPGETRLGPTEIMRSVCLPHAASGRTIAFEKMSRWTGDFATVAVAIAARIDQDSHWHEVRIVLGAVAPVPWRACAVERALEGKRVAPADLGSLLREVLAREAHPLPGNVWKLDAAAGLAARVAARLIPPSPAVSFSDADTEQQRW